MKIIIIQRKFIKNYIQELKRCLDRLNFQKIEEVISILMKAYNQNKKVFILGNGGSASRSASRPHNTPTPDGPHILCELKVTKSASHD